MSGDSDLLRKAKELGDSLMGAFSQSPKGIPTAEVNLASGEDDAELSFAPPYSLMHSAEAVRTTPNCLSRHRTVSYTLLKNTRVAGDGSAGWTGTNSLLAEMGTIQARGTLSLIL